MNDLFSREQQVLDDATLYLQELREGAVCEISEYALLVKEYGRLLKQMRRITKISDMTTENLNINNQALQDKVHYDAVTGIYSRRFLEERLVQLYVRLSRTENTKLGVLMIDIDFFKRYNDTYGHNMGDTCLKTVAQALHEALLGDGEFVARYGGEEFLAVLPNTDEVGAQKIAARLLASVRDCKIPHKQNEVAEYVTVSIGVTAGRVCQFCDAQAFVQKADEALYLSKQTGRNKITFIRLEEVTE